MSRASISDIGVQMPPHEVRKRVKIVVVDDDEDSFPTAGLQADGYTVEPWTRIDSQRLRRLESGDFDIIVLDIQGIAEPSLSDTGDGLGILRRIKQVNPDQIVVAFSGQTFDLAAVPFWKSTDDAIRKPVTLIQCKEVLDRLIADRISVRAYWSNLSRILDASGVAAGRKRNLERHIVGAAKAGRQISLENVRDIVGTIDGIDTVIAWARKIIAICSLAL